MKVSLALLFPWYFQLLGIYIKSHLGVLTVFFFLYSGIPEFFVITLTVQIRKWRLREIKYNLPNVMLLLSGKYIQAQVCLVKSPLFFLRLSTIPVTILRDDHFTYNKHRASHGVYSNVHEMECWLRLPYLIILLWVCSVSLSHALFLGFVLTTPDGVPATVRKPDLSPDPGVDPDESNPA